MSITEPAINQAAATEGGIHASVDASLPPSVLKGWLPTELEAVIVEAGRLLHASRHRLVVALAAFERDGRWALTGARTCAHCAAERLGVAVGTAREWLRVGHALVLLPALDTAMADGRLSYRAIRILTRVAVDHPERAGELVELAERARPGDLGRDLARWALGHDTDGQREERERRQTHLSWRIEPDGMGAITVRLPAVDLGAVQVAVDARVMQSTATDPLHRRPSLGHQRARALVELLSTGDGSTGSGAKIITEVIVHVRSDGVSLHDGTPLADNVLAGLVDIAFIRALIHDAENRPVNASTRRRHPTPRQKRVVDERHPRCIDCGGTELLEYDHKPPYAISHQTHTDRLFPRCPHCHDRTTAAENERRSDR